MKWRLNMIKNVKKKKKKERNIVEYVDIVDRYIQLSKMKKKDSVLCIMESL